MDQGEDQTTRRDPLTRAVGMIAARHVGTPEGLAAYRTMVTTATPAEVDALVTVALGELHATGTDPVALVRRLVAADRQAAP